jgi:hypothetical protein
MSCPGMKHTYPEKTTNQVAWRRSKTIYILTVDAAGGSSMQDYCLICLEEGPDTPPPCGAVPTLHFHKRCLDMATVAVQSKQERGQVKCPHCNVLCPRGPRNKNDMIENNNKKKNNTLFEQNNSGADTTHSLTSHSSPDRHHCMGQDILITRMDTAKYVIQNVMDRWLQDRGYWHHGPAYIQITDFMMNHHDAGVIRGAICGLVHARLCQLTNKEEECIMYSFHPHDQEAMVYRHRDTDVGIETNVTLRRTAVTNCRRGSIQMDGYTIYMSRSRYSQRGFRPAYELLSY